MQLQYPHRLWLDYETRSPHDIKRGSYVYAEGPSECILAMYALDAGPVHVWQPAIGEPMPQLLHDCFNAPQHVQIAAHNTDFDRVQMLYWPWAQQYDLNPARWYCTMTAMRMASLPGSLDEACKALGMPAEYAKKDGNALIRLFCVPRTDGSFAQPHEHPAEWARFVDYGVRDVVAMREAMRLIPDVFSPTEQAFKVYSDVMNDRGVPIDRDLAVTAMLQSDALKADAKREARRVTSDDDFNPASSKAILEFAAMYGVKLPDTRKSTLEKALDTAAVQEQLPPTVQKVLALRLRSNKTSTSKYSAVLKGTNTDDRARGLIGFYGARTGRDAGRRFQPQNLARPMYIGEKYKTLTMDEACEIVKQGTAALHFENPMQLLSDTVRGTLAATPGTKLVSADLSAIEGRVLPWQMGEDWKTDYFRRLDAGLVKYDGYQLAYSVAFGVDPATVTKAQRQHGKPIELATGYQGGVGALITFAALYSINIDEMAAAARAVADPYLWRDCNESFPWFEERGMTYGLSRDTWTGCQYIVKAWRNKHPATVEGWKRAEEAFRLAIENPGVSFAVSMKSTVRNVGGWLFMQLPSGRMLVYPHASMVDRPGSRQGQRQLAFWGVNPFTKRWGQIYTHGGRIAENEDQAIARDVLFWAIPKVEAAGYPVILRVHDELLCQVPDDPYFSGKTLAKIMATPHEWCADLPLNAVGEDLRRYQK